MPMRSIVCLFDGMNHEFSALETALGMAKNAAAHLRILYVTYPMTPTSSGTGQLFLSPELMESIKRSRDELTETARKAADELCQKYQLQLDGNGCSLPKVSFLPVQGDAELMRELCLCDIIVVGAERKSDVLTRSPVDAALFHSGRPLLVVRPRPDGGPARFAGGVCAIAWNGSPQVVRALISARSIIEGSRQAYILVTDDASAGESNRGRSAALDYLASCGVDAMVKSVDRGKRSAADAVLATARDLQCDVIIMGAYGHSVFREMVLGGFTEHMLENCEIPLVLCH